MRRLGIRTTLPDRIVWMSVRAPCDSGDRCTNTGILDGVRCTNAGILDGVVLGTGVDGPGSFGLGGVDDARSGPSAAVGGAGRINCRFRWRTLLLQETS